MLIVPYCNQPVCTEIAPGTERAARKDRRGAPTSASTELTVFKTPTSVAARVRGSNVSSSTDNQGADGGTLYGKGKWASERDELHTLFEQAEADLPFLQQGLQWNDIYCDVRQHSD